MLNDDDGMRFKKRLRDINEKKLPPENYLKENHRQ